MTPLEANELKNTAQTVADLMTTLGAHEAITPTPDAVDFSKAHIITLPDGRKVADLSEHHRKAAEFLKPARRKGHARPKTLQSLIDWSNRFKGETSVLYANPDMASPTITCIADYHAEGPATATDITGDPTARHCSHRATYAFPLSNEWKAWMAVAKTELDKDEMGEFIEKYALDVMDPTPAIIAGEISDANEGWENRLIETAQRLEGKYGQLSELLHMSKHFEVHETSNLKVVTNRDTGEKEIQFLNEHSAPDGQPLRVPNLITIAIPVFLNGAPYRMTVRFRYRKSGQTLKFSLSIYNWERVFEAAFEEATANAQQETGLPLFLGEPEG